MRKMWLTVKTTRGFQVVPAEGRRPRGVPPYTRDDIRSWCREGDQKWTRGAPPEGAGKVSEAPPEG